MLEIQLISSQFTISYLFRCVKVVRLNYPENVIKLIERVMTYLLKLNYIEVDCQGEESSCNAF